MATSSTTTDKGIRKDSYTRNCVLSCDRIRFFNNEFFQSHFQQYLSKMFNVEWNFQLTRTHDIDIELIGAKQNVKNARDDIKQLFEYVKEIIFNRENKDQQMIYWSQKIIFDSIIPVIQNVTNKEQIFALWDKTAMLSGHLKTFYFTQGPFATTVEKISEVLTREIHYIADVHLPKEKTKTFITTLDEFIVIKQHPELAFIQCRYPFTTEIKISLFGRKNLIKKIKRQLQSIIHKHTIQVYPLKFNNIQQDYLLENCSEQIQDIENEYKDDNVKIRIRLKEFSAPLYVYEKVKQRINDLVFYSTVCRFRKIGNDITLTDDQRTQIYQIAKRNYCRIEKFENQTSWIVCTIPKASATSATISNLTLQRSNEFCSKLSMKKVSIQQSSIEIYLTHDITSIPRDVTIISSHAGAADEHTEYLSDNGYFEVKSGRKFLFHLWSPVISNDEKHNKKFKRSVEKFVSSTLQSVVSCCPRAKKIVFSTSNWENMDIEYQKQLVEILINEIKRDIENQNSKWDVLFLFNRSQQNLYTEFSRILAKLQTDQDSYAHISCPISVILITLITSSNNDLLRSEYEINEYVQQHILTDQSFDDELDLKQWDQHMLNAFYGYCLTKSVLPQIDLLNTSKLIGSTSDVEKTITKFKLMCEISKRMPSTLHNQTQMISTRFNIYFSYCYADRSICHTLMTYLTNEGYSLCKKPSKKSVSTSDIENSDVFLVGFSEEYATDSFCITELDHAKSIRKILIPFIIRQHNKDDRWMSSLTIATLFYDLFETEIDLEFTDDFDLEYDRLLSSLLRYTKPGVIGQIYPAPRAVEKKQDENVEYQEIIFGSKSVALQKITSQQSQQLQLVYQQELQKKVKMNKKDQIPMDEIDDLVAHLIGIVDDIQTILAGRDPYAAQTKENDDNYSRRGRPWELDHNCQKALYDYVNCIKRWLEKAPNVTKGHIPPFTPTGDVNDALFTMYQSSEDENFRITYEPFDCSRSPAYFSMISSDLGSTFNDEQADEYFARLIRKTKPKDDMEMEIEKNEIAWQYKVSLDQIDGRLLIGDTLKTPEEMRKLEAQDNPSRIWKKTRGAKAFIDQKIKNILEFQALCERVK